MSKSTGSFSDFKAAFAAFSKFGDSKSDGEHISLKQSDKWMKQANVFEKKISTTDTGIHFAKLKSQKVSFADYEKFLEDIATTKKVDLAEIKGKMTSCGAPGVQRHSVSGKAAANVERLTDVSKYTGAHKERFDETGKGKGAEGRRDKECSSGYVSGYKNKDTYDNKKE